MEALLFMVNSLIMVLIVFQGLRDDRRPPGAPAKGIFRTRDLTPASLVPADAHGPPPPDPWDIANEAPGR